MLVVTPSQHQTAVRLPSLTSLRWFAASTVFLRHGAELLAGTSLAGAYAHFAPQGATGVSFFFILSGFVLAWSYRAGDQARPFYRRRIARIVPAYLAAWVLSILARVIVGGAHTLAAILKGLVSVTLLQAWVPIRSVYYGTNSVAWSLSTEVFFYALFPLLIVPVMRLNRRGLALTLAAMATVSIVIPLLLRPTQESAGLGFWAIYINPAYRLPEFVIGLCLCGLIRGGLRLRIPPLVAASVAVAGYLIAGAVPIYAMWVAVTLVPFSVLIFACAESDIGGRRTILWHPGLIRLGEWSYSFYLLHKLVVDTTFTLFDASLPTIWHVALLVGSYFAAILAAYLLFRFVERPFERRLRTPRSAGDAARSGRQRASIALDGGPTEATDSQA